MIPFETRLAAALKNSQAESIRLSGRHSPPAYLAAVSGGADSTAMLVGLAALRGEMGFTLYCVHVEHGIRPAEESRGDALAVQNLCEKLEIPCSIVSIPPGKIAAFAAKAGTGVEAAARFFRHKALRRERRNKKAGWILTAHTRDDLLETILMRVLRGSGPAGLAPMPQTRGRLLRPLLDLSRRDLLDYLEEKEIPYRTDSTNTDIAFLRNRIRFRLVPVLDDYFPSWRSSLLALAKTQALTADFLAAEVCKRLPWEWQKQGDESFLRLRETDFLAAPPILREEAVFAGTDMITAKDGFTNHAPRREAVRLATASGAAGDLGPVRLEKKGGYLNLKAKSRRGGERGFSLLIKETGFYSLKCKSGMPRLQISVFEADAENNAAPEVFSACFNARLPLIFRNHERGDLILKGGRNRRFSDILDRDVYSGYTGIITACDAGGTVAFIGLGENLLIIKRDTGGKYCLKVSVEGKNV